MITIPMPEETFVRVQQRAAAEGFPSSEAFISDCVQHYLMDEDEVLENFFTPQILREIDMAAEEADHAEGIDLNEMRKHI